MGELGKSVLCIMSRELTITLAIDLAVLLAFIEQ